MAKRTAKVGDNGAFNPEITQGFVDELKSHVADLLSERGIYMKKCRTIRDEMSVVYERAKEAGIPTKILKLIMKEIEAIDKLEAAKAKLEEDSRETYEQVRASLGQLADTPLGTAAMSGVDSAALDRLS